jgi:excisionase family DNA binding protein
VTLYTAWLIAILPQMAEELLTPAEVSKLVRLSLKTIYRAIRSAELQASCVRSRYLIRRRDVDFWLENSRVQPASTFAAQRHLGPGGAGSRTALRKIEQAA